MSTTTETILLIPIFLVIAVLLVVVVGMSIATKKQLDEVCDEVERIKINPLLKNKSSMENLFEEFKIEMKIKEIVQKEIKHQEPFIDRVRILNRKP